MSLPWNPTKAKIQLRLSVQRLRTLQQKKEAQAKAARRDIATLLERSKLETARIKVETSDSSVINEDVYMELLELLELYCELLLARFGILDQNTRVPDPGIVEGICSIIRAAPSTELKELHTVRDILMHKYGREFSVSVMENKDGCVSERVMRKLDLGTPSDDLVNGYLSEIAKAYGVPWSSSPSDAKFEETANKEEAQIPKNENTAPEKGPEPAKSSQHDVKSGTGTTAQTNLPPPSPPSDEFELLSQRFAALKKR